MSAVNEQFELFGLTGKDRVRKPEQFHRRGIVIAAGKFHYFANSWLAIRLLRKHGCSLPIQVWYGGEDEMDNVMIALLARFGVEIRNASTVVGSENRKIPRRAGLKSFGVIHSGFREVLLLDADNVPVRDPEYLFDCPEFKRAGAVFWPLPQAVPPQVQAWQSHGPDCGAEVEFDGGQCLLNLEAVWDAFSFAYWLENEADSAMRSATALRLAWRKFDLPIAIPSTPPQVLELRETPNAIVCQHDFQGDRIFQHRRAVKLHLLVTPTAVPGALFEPDCVRFLGELRQSWSGRVGNNVVTAKEVEVERNELLELVYITDVFENLPQVLNAELEKDAIHLGGAWPCKTSDSRRRKSWREFRFLPDGTLGHTASWLFLFWDLTLGKKGAELRIYGEESLTELKLYRSERGLWEGTLTLRELVLNARLASVERSCPGASPLPQREEMDANRIKVRTALRRKYGTKVNLTCSSRGIGDNIATVYAAVAAANAGLEVVFQSRHAPWLERVCHPGLDIVSSSPRELWKDIRGGGTTDLYDDFFREARYARSRARWYSSILSPLLWPERPKSIDKTVRIRRFDFDHYAVVAPSAHWKIRDWPAIHWRRLLLLLKGEGLEVVVIGTTREAARIAAICDDTSAFYVLDQSPDWVVDVVLGASMLIANDSGMAHVGGLLQVPTIAVHSFFPPDLLWDCTEVIPVTSETRCTFCRGNPDEGFQMACNSGCSALATIGPEKVLCAVQEVLSVQNRVSASCSTENV